LLTNEYHDDEYRLDPVITHVLEEGETWRDFNMEQPNRTFSHLSSWSKHCRACEIDTRREAFLA
jgi:hypothetical protein